MAYFTNIGPILWRHGYGAIGVLESRDNHMPIGMALEVGWDEAGRSLWRLTIHGAELPGPWVVVDRQSHPVR
jgi:hypothetical protein